MVDTYTHTEYLDQHTKYMCTCTEQLIDVLWLYLVRNNAEILHVSGSSVLNSFSRSKWCDVVNFIRIKIVSACIQSPVLLVWASQKYKQNSDAFPCNVDINSNDCMKWSFLFQ